MYQRNVKNDQHNTNWRFVRNKLKYYFTRSQSYFIHESPRRNISSFRTNGMQAYIIQYTILMMIQWYIFVYIIYTFYPLLSPPPCSWLSPHNGQEEWLVTTSGWQPLSWILPNFSLTLSSYLTQHLLTWLLQLTIKIYCKDWSTFNTAILSWIWWK